MRCPAGVFVQIRKHAAGGGGIAMFATVCAACALRSQCTEARSGRAIRIHRREVLLLRYRTQQRSGTVAQPTTITATLAGHVDATLAVEPRPCGLWITAVATGSALSSGSRCTTPARGRSRASAVSSSIAPDATGADDSALLLAMNLSAPAATHLFAGHPGYSRWSEAPFDGSWSGDVLQAPAGAVSLRDQSGAIVDAVGSRRGTRSRRARPRCRTARCCGVTS